MNAGSAHAPVLLLVDFENVQHIDLSALNTASRVVIFVGASQKSLPIDLVVAAQKLGDRIEWRKCTGNGRNALDFHIAAHLGQLLERKVKDQCIILSRDSGYDPLIQWLKTQGLNCRRINSMLELAPKPLAGSPDFERVVAILAKSPKPNRPRKRDTLANHVAAMLKKESKSPEVQRLIDHLFAQNIVREVNGLLSWT